MPTVYSILGVLALLALLFFYARKAGSDATENKELKSEIKSAEIRNEIEAEDSKLSRDDIVDKLRRLDGQ